MGVLVPPVGNGVEKLDGSSEVKIVAVEGERVYLAASVERRAGVKPAPVRKITKSLNEMEDSSAITHLGRDFHFRE